jgi:hypothetical protein
VRQPDFYAILRVPRTASDSQIRAAHRRLVKSVHPDVGDGADEERFRLVQLAYETLIDPDSRAHYDRTRPKPAPRQKPRPRPTPTAPRSEPTRPRRQQKPDPRRPVVDWTPGECWKCKWRTGHPSLHIKMEKMGAPTHFVAIPHCDTCTTPIPRLPMATADFVVFSSVMAVAAFFVVQFLVAGLSGFSGLGVVLSGSRARPCSSAPFR